MYPNYYQPPPPKSHQPNRGLITAGIIISSILLALIFAAGVFTIAKVRQENRIMAEQRLEDSLRHAVNDMAATSASSFSNYLADAQADQNSTLYSSIRTNMPYGATDRDRVNSALDEMQSRTADVCSRIRNLCGGFSDTVNIPGMSTDGTTTMYYFVFNGRAKQLQSDLQDYRDFVMGQVNGVSTSSTLDLKDYLPIDDISAGSTSSWDQSKFYGSTFQALEYLKELEVDVRNFENAALKKFPYNY